MSRKLEPVETMSRMALMQECHASREEIHRLRKALRGLDEMNLLNDDNGCSCSWCGRESEAIRAALRALGKI